MPSYDVKPGNGVGIFKLGYSLWHILDILQADKITYPKLEIAWDESQPHKSPVTIYIPQLLITLFFESERQVLSWISMPLPSPLILTYNDQNLSTPDASSKLTRVKIGKLLGPTHERQGETKLVYPGIEFECKGMQREDEIEKIIILPRNQDAQGTEGEGIQSALVMLVEVLVGVTTSQDLLLDLGAPLRKYWKEDDRMERMWGDQTDLDSHSTKGQDQCFWNYFQHGLDFLVGDNGLIVKIIVHSNIPGTPLFQQYARCPWKISTPTESLTLSSPITDFRAALGGSSAPPANPEEIRLTVPVVSNGSADNGGKKKKRSGSSTSNTRASTPNIKSLEQANSKVDDDRLETMFLDRVGEGGLDGVKGMSGSRLTGFDGLVIEEDQKHGGICSVLVYQHPQPSS